MIKITKDLIVKCNHCGDVTQVDADSCNCDTFSYERNMGDEIEYDFDYEFCCEGCGKWIGIKVRGYEYPVGAFNYSDYECDGGELLEKPLLEMEYEDYEFDDGYTNFVYEEYLTAEDLLEFERRRIQSMAPREFENFVGEIFERLGYNVRVTNQTRDGGFDVIATKADPIPFTLIIECKHWKEKVDVKVIRGVYGVQTAMKANKSVVVTSSKFTRDARKFAETQEEMMTLWDIDDLLRILYE